MIKCLKSSNTKSKIDYKYRAFLLSLRKKNMAIFIALIDEYTQRGCLDRTIKSFSQAET